MPGATARYVTDPSRHVAIGNVEDLLICVFADAVFSDAVFQSYVTARSQFVESCPPCTATMTVSQSFTPNLRQRGMLKEAEAALRLEILRTWVVVSDSPPVRNAVAAVSWMFPKKWALKSFNSTQLVEAATYLRTNGVRASESSVLACVEKLRSLLPARPE